MIVNTGHKGCLNCKTDLQGKYCHECGEKVIEDKDYSIKSILNQSVGAIFNFDSKFFRSLGHLLFKPGNLTVAYVQGVRTNFMRPFQLFVIANLMFFFFMSDSDFFRIPAKYHFGKEHVKNTVESISKNQLISIEDVAILYDEKSLSWSKTALILIIPFIGLIMTVINFNKKYFFGTHLIFATHFMSFFLIFLSLIGLFNTYIFNTDPVNFKIPILISVLIYSIWSIKVFYQDKIWLSILKGILSTALIIVILILYRGFISATALYLIS